MRLVALTGGIGSGKSSVSDRLAANGAEIVDADIIVRELQQPGQPIFGWMVERWGAPVVGPDGSLDRGAVASIVFGDGAELRALEAAIHPEVRKAMDQQVAGLAGSDRVVVLDIPLLAEGRKPGGTAPDGRGASAVIVVDCPIDIAVERLVKHRGFKEADVHARVAKQVSREERLSLADFVIDNGGTKQELDAEVQRCWSWIGTLDDTVWPPKLPTGKKG